MGGRVVVVVAWADGFGRAAGGEVTSGWLDSGVDGIVG